MSCRQQTAPPLRDAAKMSPRIRICPESVLAAHAPSPTAEGSHVRPEKTQLPIVEQNFSAGREEGREAGRGGRDRG
jgi:hypothetical protein